MEKRSFSSTVIFSEKNKIALKNTLFYPEGGGQLGDIGIIEWDGKKSKVVDVQKVGDVVVHQIEGDAPSIGTNISGTVDDEHRTGLSRHHTATHLIGAAARGVLGNHIWQAGASKSVDRARLDITHHRRLNRDVIESIEAKVNNLILENNSRDKLVLAALNAANKSYAPYSKGYSGIALMTEDGSIFQGYYAENAAFNPSISPIEFVLSSLNFSGISFNQIKKVVLVEKRSSKSSQINTVKAVLKRIVPYVKLNVVYCRESR